MDVARSPLGAFYRSPLGAKGTVVMFDDFNRANGYPTVGNHSLREWWTASSRYYFEIVDNRMRMLKEGYSSSYYWLPKLNLPVYTSIKLQRTRVFAVDTYVQFLGYFGFQTVVNAWGSRYCYVELRIDNPYAIPGLQLRLSVRDSAGWSESIATIIPLNEMPESETIHLWYDVGSAHMKYGATELSLTPGGVPGDDLACGIYVYPYGGDTTYSDLAFDDWLVKRVRYDAM